MPTAEGCGARRARLWKSLPDHVDTVVITDPPHLVYFAGFCPSPFVFNSQNARGALILRRDGSAVLVADNVQEAFAKAAFVTESVLPTWYRCIESAGCRNTLLMDAILGRLRSATVRSLGYEPSSCPAGLIDGLRKDNAGLALNGIEPVIRTLRRSKDADEVVQIRRALDVATRALRAAMAGIVPGMTELDAYTQVVSTATAGAGQQALVYGDFVSGPRCEQIGGPPSARVIEAGDLVLLDFSVVLGGYRGDFCNTFVCGSRANPRQREMFDACVQAMVAGEGTLRAGVSCRDVFKAVHSAFASHGLANYFPHHAGHGVGLGHPEPPYLVPESAETLIVGDVVTLEPGLYIPGTAAMRYERNYLITDFGYELLADNPISIDAA